MTNPVTAAEHAARINARKQSRGFTVTRADMPALRREEAARDELRIVHAHARFLSMRARRNTFPHPQGYRVVMGAA